MHGDSRLRFMRAISTERYSGERSARWQGERAPGLLFSWLVQCLSRALRCSVALDKLFQRLTHNP